jgi:hypothetical protein
MGRIEALLKPMLQTPSHEQRTWVWQPEHVIESSGLESAISDDNMVDVIDQNQGGG